MAVTVMARQPGNWLPARRYARACVARANACLFGQFRCRRATHNFFPPFFYFLIANSTYGYRSLPFCLRWTVTVTMLNMDSTLSLPNSPLFPTNT